MESSAPATQKVSVIIPVYNTEKYLKRCIDSVLAQTYRNIEILLVDDGSRDNSGSICDEYAVANSDVKVIHKENGGLSDARNAGMANANGDFFIFVDSDDCIDAHMVEVCVTAQNKTSASLVGFNWQQFDNDLPKARKSQKIKCIKSNKIIRYLLTNNRLYCVVRYLFSKEIIKQNNLTFDTNVKMAEDQLFIYTYAKHCNKLAMLDYDGYFYYSNQDSITGGIVKPNHYYDLEIRKKILDDCDKKNKKQAKAHLLKGYIAFCLKALKYGSACEEDIVKEYRAAIKKNIMAILFSPYINFSRKMAAFSVSVSVSMTKKLIKRRGL